MIAIGVDGFHFLVSIFARNKLTDHFTDAIRIILAFRRKCAVENARFSHVVGVIHESVMLEHEAEMIFF